MVADQDVRATHDVGQMCECVASHSPVPQHLHRHHILPLFDGGTRTPENERWLCPSAHLANTHPLYLEYKRHEGDVPWEIRRRYSPFVRALAAEGYRRLKAKEVA